MNEKVGFEFYKVETDRYDDVRIRRLNANCGTMGLSVYDYLLARIYRYKGCYIVCDDDCIFAVSEYLKMKESAVKEIISYCGSVGLFHGDFIKHGTNGELLTCGSILTSASIQRRYVDMCETAKRKSFEMPRDYILIHDILDDNKKFRLEDGDNFKIPEFSAKIPEKSTKIPEFSAKFPESLRNTPEFSRISIVKYSIVKYIRENNTDSIVKENESSSGDEYVVANAPTAPLNIILEESESSAMSSESSAAEPKLTAEQKHQKQVQARKARERALYQELVPYVETYGKEMVRAFYDYWTQTNSEDDVTNLMDVEKRKKGKFCVSRRLATWKRNDDERKSRGAANHAAGGANGSAACTGSLGKARGDYKRADDLTSQVIL